MTDLNGVMGAFGELVSIMRRLRRDCPWDREQTLESLLGHTIEEVYELYDAVLGGKADEVKEELGDLAMHVVFYAIIGSEKNWFDLEGIFKRINEKLIFRHPHIFEKNEVLKTAEEVLENWQKMKKKEGKKNALMGVSGALPAITKAMRIQAKAKQSGFEFEDVGGVLEKCREEIREFEGALKSKDKALQTEELGDVFFALVNYARFVGIDAEYALQKSNQKFMDRFTMMENLAIEEGVSFKSLSLEEKERLWVRAKEKLKK